MARLYNAAKVAATKAAVEEYVKRNRGKKIALEFDTVEQAAEVYRWFHAVPRNDCTAVVTYFKDHVLTVYEPEGPAC